MVLKKKCVVVYFQVKVSVCACVKEFRQSLIDSELILL